MVYNRSTEIMTTMEDERYYAFETCWGIYKEQPIGGGSLDVGWKHKSCFWPLDGAYDGLSEFATFWM